MPRDGLTTTQEAFAQGVASGLSLAEAFRRAKPKALNWKPETVWQYGSRWMADGKVSARIDQIKAELAQQGLWKREDSVRILSEIAGTGEKDADRVRAVSELNAMHGFNAPQKHEINGAMRVEEIRRVVVDPGDI